MLLLYRQCPTVVLDPRACTLGTVQHAYNRAGSFFVCSPTTMQPNHHAAGTSTAWTASHAFVSSHFSEDAPSNQMVWLKHKKTGAANAATPVSDVIQELKIRNRLLIQLLFDGFLAIFGAEGSPKSVWTFTAGATFPTTSITVVTAISDVILITSLN